MTALDSVQCSQLAGGIAKAHLSLLGFQSVATSATPASPLGRALTLLEDKGCRSRQVVQRPWGYGADGAPVLCFSSNKNRNNNKCRCSIKKKCERAFTKKKADVTGDRVRGDFLFLFLFEFLIL